MRSLTISDPALLGSRRSYRAAVLADSPVGYWPLDDAGSTMADVSGAGLNGTYTNSPTLSAGTGPGGRDCHVFNGTNQYGLVGAPVVTAAQPATVELWLKTTNTALRTPIALRNPPDGGEVLLLVMALSVAGQPTAYRAGGTGKATWSTTIHDGNWHHVVMTVNSANNDLSLYVDGTLRSTDASPGSPSVSTSNIGLWVGCNSGPGQYFPGSVADVAVYASTLNSTRVAAHYAAGI